MHVLFVLEYFAPHIGGVETLFSRIVDELLERGYQVSVVTSRYDKTLSAQESYKTNCTIYRVGTNRIDFPWYGFWKGLQICRRQKIDLIHTTTFTAAIAAGLLRKITRIPTIVHVHEIYGKLWYRFMGWKGFFYRRVEDLIFLFRFDKYLCVSHYTKNCLRLVYGITDDKLLTVYNAIDYDFWQPDKNLDIGAMQRLHHLEKKKIVLYFGRAGVAKGLDDLLHAIPHIVQKNSTIHFVLIVPENTKKHVAGVSDTIDQDLLTRTIQKYSPYISRLPGQRGDALKHWIQIADLVVLPSHAEGFGFAIAEVCALGIPLLTTNVAAIPEVVCGDVLFVEPGDVAAIATQIVGFCDGTLRPEHLPVKKFFRKDTFDLILDVYKKIVFSKEYPERGK